MSDNILRRAISQQYQWIGKSAGRIGVLDAAVRSIGLEGALEGLDGYVSINSYSDVRKIEITFYSLPRLTADTESNPLQIVARRLAGKLGRLDKGFNATQNLITLSARVQDVMIILAMSTPQTCSVETVEEEVEVAEVPAHKEKKVRYVLKGDCDPWMTPAEPAPASEVL